jgi:hypothetical protein
MLAEVSTGPRTERYRPNGMPWKMDNESSLRARGTPCGTDSHVGLHRGVPWRNRDRPDVATSARSPTAVRSLPFYIMSIAQADGVCQTRGRWCRRFAALALKTNGYARRKRALFYRK